MMNNRIFLSHSSKDIEAVRHLAEDLKRAGVSVWLDEWEIKVGDYITQKIQEGLHSANYLAVWLTRNAVESGWVEKEWQSKYSKEIKSGSVIILPLLAEDCEVPELLSEKSYADFRKDYIHGLSGVLRVIGMQPWENKLGIKFAPILPGSFLMGSVKGEENEKPVHPVSINELFFMGIYVITQAQWRTVMDIEPWKGMPHVKEGDDYPATHITWHDTKAFLKKLRDIDSENSYLLPHEKEWEYAARAGTTTEFSFGNDDRFFSWYGWNRDETDAGERYAHQVGVKRPNPWGLYDMHGNVWEWTSTWYEGGYNAKYRPEAEKKILRGGAWDYSSYGARSAFRASEIPTRTNATIGFRLIMQRS